MQNKTDNQVYAGFFVRLAAYLIDSIIVGLGLMVIRLPIWISSMASPDNVVVRNFIFEYSLADIVLYVLGVLYFILMTYYTGYTIGKKLLHLRVVSVEDRKPTLFEIVYRETVGRFLSALIIYAGYLLVLVHREKQGLHDLLGDTKVVYYHEKQEYVQTPVAVKEVLPVAPSYAPVTVEEVETESQEKEIEIGSQTEEINIIEE